MDNTTSLELSNQLKDAGAKQESERAWLRDYDPKTDKPTDRCSLIHNPIAWIHDDYDQDWCAAFGCDELMKRLPPWTSVTKMFGSAMCYRAYTEAHNWDEVDDTPAEALGLLYKWCLKEGHCNE